MITSPITRRQFMVGAAYATDKTQLLHNKQLSGQAAFNRFAVGQTNRLV